MKGKRTNIDFSKHEHRVETFKSGEGNTIRIDHLQIGTSNCKYIQFVNTDRTLTVTGDYGNWVFCRPFLPSKKGNVSEGYWIEKMKIMSEQRFEKLDWQAIEDGIKENIVECDVEGNIGKREWYEELLEVAESRDELLYTCKAYRDPYMPSFIDHNDIPYYKEMPVWLEIIFDAFDEICRRLKDND